MSADWRMMTYRRLYFLILGAMTLAVLGIWGFSLRAESLVAFTPRKYGMAISAGIRPGTFYVRMSSRGYRPWNTPFHSEVFWYGLEDLDSLVGRGGFTGAFGAGPFVEQTFSGPINHQQLMLPIWLPWIALTTGAMVVTRRLEKRISATPTSE